MTWGWSRRSNQFEARLPNVARLARKRGDLTGAMLRFVTAYLEAQLSV
jgi:hypothetical protein